MSWYKVTFSPDDISAGQAIAMIREFSDQFVLAAGPKDAGLFKSHESMYEYYFSPKAAEIAMALIHLYSAKSCAAPSRSDVKAVAADGSDLDLFPFSDT